MGANVQVLQYPDFESGGMTFRETSHAYFIDLPLCTKPIKAELDKFFVSYCNEDIKRHYLLNNTNIESTQINTLGKTLYKYSIRISMSRHFIFDPFAKQSTINDIKSFAESLDAALRLKELQRN